MAPIRLELCQNAFQTIPDISFFDAETKQKQNWFCCKLWRSVYPPRMAPFGLKLWENAFQTIPDISFFDAEKKKSSKDFVKQIFATPRKSVKCLFWRSCEFLDVNSRSALKIHCQTYRFQPFTTLGGGVKKAVSVFFVSFGKKNLHLLRSEIQHFVTMISSYDDTNNPIPILKA